MGSGGELYFGWWKMKIYVLSCDGILIKKGVLVVQVERRKSLKVSLLQPDFEVYIPFVGVVCRGCGKIGG